jgi:hypothetical protein
MVINAYTGSYRCGDTSASGCARRAAVRADVVEQIVINAVREYTGTARGPASREQRVREADQRVERAQAAADIDKLPDPPKRLAAWRRLITDTVAQVTVPPATTADGRRHRILTGDIVKFLGQ